MPKRLISLSTDSGNHDHYALSVKLEIWKRIPDQRILELGHTFKPFDIKEAAYFLNHTISDFPEKTIHIIALGDESLQSFLLCQFKQQYFLAPDNGIISLITSPELVSVYQLPSVKTTFYAKDILAKAACDLIRGTSSDSLGERIDTYVKLIPDQLRVSQGMIFGKVVYIDNYGNLITNITRDYINSIMLKNKYTSFAVRMGSTIMNSIVENFFDTEPGDVYVLYNSSDELQIGIYLGNASQLLGGTLDKNVIIEFE